MSALTSAFQAVQAAFGAILVEKRWALCVLTDPTGEIGILRSGMGAGMPNTIVQSADLRPDVFRALAR